jgi:hypothetical protein
MLVFLLLLASANAAPIFIYSNDEQLLAGRNHYVDGSTEGLFTSDPSVSALPTSLFSQKSIHSPSSVLSIILLTEEPVGTFATTDNWLKEAYVGAPSSVVVPQFEGDLIEQLSSRNDVLRFDGNDLDYTMLTEKVAHAMIETPKTRTLLISIKSLQQSGSRYLFVKFLNHFVPILF